MPGSLGGTAASRSEKTSAAVVDYVLEELFEGRPKSGDRVDLDEVSEALGTARLRRFRG